MVVFFSPGAYRNDISACKCYSRDVCFLFNIYDIADVCSYVIACLERRVVYVVKVNQRRPESYGITEPASLLHFLPHYIRCCLCM